MPAADEASPVSDAEAAALFADLVDLPGLLIAVSGGPDSTALLVLIARWRGALRTGPDLLAATVDHGLRPEARREAATVGELAARLGVPHQTLAWRGDKPRSGVQEAARAARYRLLAGAARRAGMHHILTAHTRDDQAETVLFRLARGSGIAGLAGMARFAPVPEAAGGVTLVRPLLDVPKVRLVATLHRAGIAYADDASNRDPRFARARIRDVMPLLAAEGLDAAALCRVAGRARRANEALERWVSEIVRGMRPEGAGRQGSAVSLAEFRNWPTEIALRVLARCIETEGTEGPVELGKLEALLADLQAAAARGQRRWRRTLAGAVVGLADDRVSVTPAPPRRQAKKGAKPLRMRAAAAAAKTGAAIRRATAK